MKSLKVSDEAWKAAKVFAAEHNYNLQSFVELAIREKIANEGLKK
jgi:hypothetical protein